jgi:hypothetical protein
MMRLRYQLSTAWPCLRDLPASRHLSSIPQSRPMPQQQKTGPTVIERRPNEARQAGAVDGRSRAPCTLVKSLEPLINSDLPSAVGARQLTPCFLKAISQGGEHG